jgi:putative transposase
MVFLRRSRSTRAAPTRRRSSATNADHHADVEIRQVKYLNNIVEQDHRAIKRMTKAMLGFKAFWSPTITIVGIEVMHMIRKDQLRSTGKLRPVQKFYSFAG